MEDINMFQSWYACFHIGLKPSLAASLLPFLWLKSFWKRLSLLEELSSNFIIIKEPILFVRYFNKVVPLAGFIGFSLCVPPWILWFGEHTNTNDIIKTPLVSEIKTEWVIKSLIDFHLHLQQEQ